MLPAFEFVCGDERSIVMISHRQADFLCDRAEFVETVSQKIVFDLLIRLHELNHALTMLMPRSLTGNSSLNNSHVTTGNLARKTGM